MNFLSYSSPLQALTSRLFPGIELWVKRDDLLHPQVSGNKFRKLKYPLLTISANDTTLISMGGAWSNHLHALAYAGKLLEFKTIGLVRGLVDPTQTLSATLQDCLDWGMQLHFVSRSEYRELREKTGHWQRWTNADPTKSLWLPEGGCSIAAIRGVAELIEELPWIPETIILACGTGTTLAGVVAAMRNRGRIIGIAAVQNAEYLSTEVRKLLREAAHPAYENFNILHDYTHGGFAKSSPELQQFCVQFIEETQIPIEPVYTGKMFYALHQLCVAGKFKPGERVLAIHTGGLQGNRGFQPRPG
jgi:1-aminocyclopropane-1-carboxylate deaminase